MPPPLPPSDVLPLMVQRSTVVVPTDSRPPPELAAVFKVTWVLLTEVSLAAVDRPPPWPSVRLPLIVLFEMVRFCTWTFAKRPPPSEPAWLPEMIEPLIAAVPPPCRYMPPPGPNFVVLPEIVLCPSVRVEKLSNQRPPPLSGVELSVMVLFRMVRLLVAKIPPPPMPASLPEITVLTRVRFPSE